MLTVSVLYGSLFSAAAVLLEEWTERKLPSVSDLVKLFFFALTETFWYRPLTAWWRCEGVIDAIRRKKAMGEHKAERGVSVADRTAARLLVLEQRNRRAWSS
ncbi:Glycosyl transferase, group 2 family protein [Geobacillus proteiniphilus]|uniref:Glycosyl transferase, group 2 family protein n=1 Tax=Geobacillus proteiniphilus TaxID=860353 RepID=A0A1Q5T353_9BACL|nr:Glycosyl transferase, group 2 family protein [Geobacillus proteiniphilus]